MAGKKKGAPTIERPAPIYVECSTCQGMITHPAPAGARACNCAAPTFWHIFRSGPNGTEHWVHNGKGPAAQALCGRPVHGYFPGEDKGGECPTCRQLKAAATPGPSGDTGHV